MCCTIGRSKPPAVFSAHIRHYSPSQAGRVWVYCLFTTWQSSPSNKSTKAGPVKPCSNHRKIPSAAIKSAMHPNLCHLGTFMNPQLCYAMVFLLGLGTGDRIRSQMSSPSDVGVSREETPGRFAPIELASLVGLLISQGRHK